MIGRRFWRRRIQHYDDDQLVKRFQQSGNDAYFDELFERYHPLVFGLCLNLTAHREDSKDLTLRVFQKAYGALPNTTIERFDHWLLSMARHECFRFMRKDAKERSNMLRWQIAQKQEDGFLLNEAFRRLWYTEEIAQDKLLEKGLADLTTPQQKCLNLFLYEYQSYQEIAQTTGFSVREVKSHLQNGRLKLKRWIQEQQDSKNKLSK
jgi:RNA polymerase sigma-70 factor (ECF subfamily)